MRKNRLIQSLVNKSGASFVFVLGIMLLLMAIGVSALTAATAAAGANMNQHTYNELTTYAESVQKSIMYSLQTSDGLPSETLGGQLIKAMYLAEIDSDVYTLPSEFNLMLAGEDVDVDVEVEFENVNVEIIYSDPDTNNNPESADISADVKFTVKAEEDKSDDEDVKVVSYLMAYQLRGAQLVMNADSSEMEIEDRGAWRVVAYDKVEN